MINAPHLLIGDPGKANATFTRFLLPFGYQLERPSCEHFATPRYEEAEYPEWLCPAMPHGKNSPSDLVERGRYLMPEMRRVLFQRAKWFTLKNLSKVGFASEPATQDDSGITVNVPRNDSSKTSFQVTIRNPGLILMEWERELQRMHLRPGDRASSMACGFLILESFFPEGQIVSLSDLLRFNELFRYWRRPFEGHWHKEEGGYGEVLAAFPIPSNEGQHIPSPGSEDHYTERWTRWLEFPIYVPCRNGNVRILPRDWIKKEHSSPSSSCSEIESKPTWIIHPDNRAQVWTCAVHWDAKPTVDGQDPSGSDFLLARSKNFAQSSSTAPLGSTPWQQLLNVDQPGNLVWDEISAFEAAWLTDHTYSRWAHYGALYGFTPHSGAMLTAPCKEPPTWQHFRTIYFDQALMMLYVRACLFRFSERLSALTCQAARGSVSDPISQADIDAFRDLRWEFAQFTSLYQFPLISNQQQALEMYAELRRHMDIQSFYEHVRQEIETTQEFLSSELAARQTEVTTLLTVIASVGLLLGLVLSLLGAGSLMDHLKSPDADSLVPLLFIVPIGLGGLFIFVIILWVSAVISGHHLVQDFLRKTARSRKHFWPYD